MAVITCVGRDGASRQFTVAYEKNNLEDAWDFRVTAIPPLVSGEWFDMSVQPVDATTVKIIAISSNVPEYSAKGIPEALIPFAAQELGKVFVSSPRSGEAGEFRTDAASKMWERIKKSGHAKYDPIADVYTYVP